MGQTSRRSPRSGDDKALLIQFEIARLRDAGVTSTQGLARELTARGVPTLRASDWHGRILSWPGCWRAWR